MSPSTWRLADLFAKHAFLLNGLGWGGMPMHAVQDDLAAGKLVELKIEDIPPGGMILPMAAVYPTSAPPGPAGRWLIERHEALFRQTGGGVEFTTPQCSQSRRSLCRFRAAPDAKNLEGQLIPGLCIWRIALAHSIPSKTAY